MSLQKLEHYNKIWLVDFEFHQPAGERPTPVCMVAMEYRTGEKIRLFAKDLSKLHEAPFDIGQQSLFVAYFSTAELNCFLALGWPLPERILDLYVEFTWLNCGLELPHGRGLLGALHYFGLDGIEAIEKEEMRQLAMRGGLYTDNERAALLDYCETDVRALHKLLPKMLQHIDLPRALLRGRSMRAYSHMEHTGVPIDIETWSRMTSNWSGIKLSLIAEVDRAYGVYDGDSFKQERFAAYLKRNNIPWPCHPTGKLKLDEDTFRERAKTHPRLQTLHELRVSLSSLRLNELAVGHDGRNRCLLSPFRAKTSRGQPSNAKFIFGPATWLRGLIQAPPGCAIAYVDWCQQEFGIAAALSGDAAMMEAYASGDPYLTFAKQAKAVPADATKTSHEKERDQFKVCALGVQYGMWQESLALAINQPPCVARDLLALHHQTYPRYWQWSQAAVDHAMLHGYLYTVFNWRVHVASETNTRSLANFAMQANGAEMLRLACCLMTERGIAVCCPVHDAVLIEAAETEIDIAIAKTQSAMREASLIVLNGFPLRTDVKVFKHPARYMDKRGRAMWEKVSTIVDEKCLQPALLGGPDGR